MYTEHYGFSGQPFALTPDPRFYFGSATHRKAMAYLGYGLAQGEGFIVVTGDVGTGKTTLVGHLMATIDKARLTAIRIVSTQVEGDDMLRLAAQGMGLAIEGHSKADLLGRVERFLITQAREGKRTLLIVDESQNLSHSALEELRMLSNFQNGEQALLQIFLLGQPEFRDELKRSDRLEQLRQRVIATHHLDPMEPHEIEPYVVHRLALVGWSGDPQFTQAAYSALYRRSGGVPRRINQLATRLLLHGAIDGLTRLDAEDVEAVAAEVIGEAQPVRSPAAVMPAPEPVRNDAVAEIPPVVEPAPAPIEMTAEAEAGDAAAEEDVSVAYATPVVDEAPAEDVLEPAELLFRRPLPMLEPEDAVHEDIPPEPVLYLRSIYEPAPAQQEQASQEDPASEWIARVEALEARVEEQDAALRRVLTLLVDWVEAGNAERPRGDRRMHAV